MSSSLLYKIAFASLRGITPRLAEEILGRCGNEEEFFRLPESVLTTMAGFRNRLFDESYRRDLLDKARHEVQFVESNGIRTIYFTDPDYPHRLLLCEDAPLIIFTLGTCDLNNSKIISVVGTRHATVYGLELTRRIITDLADKMERPPVVVSGLAFGIDVAAHKAALEAGIPTAAVLAHGLNTIYPAAHRPIAARMVREGGLLITDYRSTDAIHRGNFLARNRIVAGLCDCLLVTESARRGGALVTAHLASGYGRDVMAVPGRAGDRYSEGCNVLISRHAAQLVTSADDIMAAMNWPPRMTEDVQKSLFVEFTPEEEAVIATLRDNDGAAFGKILAETGMPTARLMGLLVDMEFKGYLLALPGGQYRLNV